jgi:DNA-binding SARP family transcriptional activator
MLVLHRGEVVSVDRLIDELWGERPPKTVEAYIQNCISRLRGALGREAIETRRPGYLLQLDGESIDAVRFEGAVESVAALDPPERAQALREALGLWRGSPFADLEFETFVQDEIARLEELRLTALELRLDAELELGRHADVLAELTALANRHPARERLRYLQMLALYRSGRQREALRAYHDARRELVEELGLEPGEALRSLERMIITHDPTLGVEIAPTPEHGGRRVAALAVELAVDAREQVDRVVAFHGGTVRELLSDEAVAIFAGHDDDVLRALRAAVELRETRAVVRTVVDRIAADELEAVRRFLHRADTANVIVGADALAVVPAAVDVVPHESGGFRVLQFDQRAEPFARRFDTPLVDRTNELGLLNAALDDVAASNAARRLVVVGDAGVGKTRLVREFVRGSRDRSQVLVGRCVAYGEGTALLPLFQILRRVGRLETALAGEADAERISARLRDPSAVERSEGFWAFRRLLEVVARRLALVVVFEDMHMAEGTMLDLVDYLGGWASAPVMLLCLGRPELLDRRPEWRDHAFQLEPLPLDEVRTMASNLHAGIDAPSLDRAIEAAEGNPLFLEQLLASESELLPTAVPPTLEALIAGRLDALPPRERATLERASVAGRSFWRAAVEDATPPDERDAVGGDLMSLVRRRLVRPEPSELEGEDGFRFHHALIRDVAYAGIPAATRAALHESVARSLDGRHSAHDEVVGHHLEQAAQLRDDPELAREAGERLGVAGIRALKRVDARAAIDLLSRALSLRDHSRSQLELEWALATAIKFSGDWPAANTRLDGVAAKAAASGERAIELRARVEQLWPKLSSGELTAESALSFLAEARPVLESAGDDFGLGRAWHATAVILGTFQLRWTDEQEATRAAAVCYARSGFVAGTTVALRSVPLLFGPTPVRDAIEECRDLLAGAETPVWGSFVLPPLAVLEAMDGRFDDARRHLAEARIGREEFADQGTIVTSWSAEAAMVELLAGEPGRAEEILVASLEVLESGDDAGWLATNLGWLAEAQYRQARFEAALRSSERALSLSPHGYLTAVTVAGRAHAKALAQAGRFDEARARAVESADLLAATDALDERGEAAAAAAEVLTLAGDTTGARRSAADAIAFFEQKGNTVSAARVRESRRV